VGQARSHGRTAPTGRVAASRPSQRQQPRLDCRYTFIFIKSEPQIEDSMAESDPLCRGLMSRDHGSGPRDRGLIPWDSQ
jgi:hypothetical protein